MKKRLWVLGADDPEMQAIEYLLHSHHEHVAYAMSDGARVHPGNAYKADPITCSAGFDEVILVECAPAWGVGSNVVHIDHHRPGDPGFGRPPEEFLEASSIGQVIAHLAIAGIVDPSWECWDVPAGDGQELAPLPGDFSTWGGGTMMVVGVSPDGRTRWSPPPPTVAEVPLGMVLIAACDPQRGFAGGYLKGE